MSGKKPGRLLVRAIGPATKTWQRWTEHTRKIQPRKRCAPHAIALAQKPGRFSCGRWAGGKGATGLRWRRNDSEHARPLPAYSAHQGCSPFIRVFAQPSTGVIMRSGASMVATTRCCQSGARVVTAPCPFRLGGQSLAAQTTGATNESHASRGRSLFAPIATIGRRAWDSDSTECRESRWVCLALLQT